MRSWIIIPLLCSALVQLVQSQRCELGGAKRDIPFPDIEKQAMESYQMSVECTVTKAQETDYYVEYYDTLERRGRLEGHQAGKSQTYLYNTDTTEAWQITDRTCDLKNITDIPELLRNDMIEWLYTPPASAKRTFGPSGMFKYALDTWNSDGRSSKMAYMGEFEGKIRGLKAQYWRRCDTPTSHVDYYFTTDDEEDPLGLNQRRIPLRVSFEGTRQGKMKELEDQQYEIISFQPFIAPDIQPFDLPKGRGCKRGILTDAPKLPDFSDQNLQFQAEVIYRKVDFNGDDVQYWSYYSTLMMAMDQQSEHLAYYYTPWNTSKPEKDQEPTALSPVYIVYDMKHGYAYKTNIETGDCQIIREKTFVPKYSLPNGAGQIALTDPSVLFPVSTPEFLSEGVNRGLKVNIFEEVVENYRLDNTTEDDKIPKAIVSHVYLTDNEEIVTKSYVKNALVQVQLKLSGRYDKVIEILTFNFFGFSTQLRNRRSTFNVQKCFKNDDDYSWVTLGFNADNAVLEQIKNEAPIIQSNILNSIETESELNPMRIPYVLVDINEGVFVTMLILEKPPVQLDYIQPPEEGKTIIGSTEVEGIQDLESCADKCLENEDNCWAFAMCDAVCIFAATPTSAVGNKANCKLYRRYDNNTFIPTKESMINSLKSQVEENLIKLVLMKSSGDGMIQLDATSIEVTDPGEDDRLFRRIGNNANPRMRVVKAGAKLNTGVGKPIKNLGKLRFDECQRVCLDFKDCETISYCLRNSECVASNKYGEELLSDVSTDGMCSVLTRKYIDHFNRSPGNILSVTAVETADVATEEECARACLKSTKFKCLSFDHCQEGENPRCRLHTVHYPNSKTRESVQVKKFNCGHYYRKFSTEFQKNPNKRMIGSGLTPISNLTLEECSKACAEFGKGTCFGFDFCQDVTVLATSCVILDSDPSRMKSSYSEICTNYLRSEPQFAPRPYSNGYAGGIGFLCFMVGLIVGVAIVFGIAYIKVNRRG